MSRNSRMARLPLDVARNAAPTLGDLFNEAAALYQRGDLAGARRNLKTVLRKQPQQFDALHLMGLVEARRGHHKDAEVLLRQAVRVNPNAADAHANRGNVLREMGRFDEAVASYDQALALKPDYPNALNSRAIALVALGRFDEALANYDQALALDPKFATARYNRAIALVQLGRLDEAVTAFDAMLVDDPMFLQGHVDRANALGALGRIEAALAGYERALAIEPRFTTALYNRGLVLLKAGRFSEALTSFDALLAIEPAVAGALDGKGNALAGLGRHEEAVAAFAAAVEADPEFAGALNNMGFTLLKLRRAREALACFDKALRVDPRSSGILNNRGNALLALGRTDDALASFSAALAADPAALDALVNRASAALTTKLYEQAAVDFERVVALDPDQPYALGNLLYARLHCSDWREHDELQRRIGEGLRAGRKVILPFEAVACVEAASDQLLAANVWLDDVCPVRMKPATIPPRAHDRIRLGYLSADLRVHPVAILMAELFERHDRSRFETVAFSFGDDDRSEMRARVARAFETFIDVRELSDRQIADRIREMEIDVLVDLTGFTENCRPGVLALRPAPVQVSYLGYLGTMGNELVDYVIADRFSLPQDVRAHYPERVAYLPEPFIAADTTRAISDQPPSRSDMGLPADGTVFCAFHSRHKITPQMFDVWMRVLREVEGSVLWLAGGSSQSDDNLRREAQARGVAGERLVVMPRVSVSQDYLARYRLADVFLDVLPYNAISTAVDALWAGLPVLTWAGRTFGGRGAGSLLHAAGLPELVCETADAYEAAAVTLARDPAALDRCKSRLARGHASLPLFDSGRFARNIEDAYEAMWARHQRGEPPADIHVGQA